MEPRQRFGARLKALYFKHATFFHTILVLAILWAVVAWASAFYRPFRPGVLAGKESADAVKHYILSWGNAAPVFFIGLQVAQVVVAPIPGQAVGFAGGYVFGWRKGILYTMLGLGLGSWLVLLLARKFGRGFVEKLQGAEALKDFENLFLNKETTREGLYGKSKTALRSHGLLTFFIIMLLPALPDDLVCFIAGLTRIPIWQLMAATLVGRFPGMLVLAMAGDGFSKAQSNRVFLLLVGICVLVAAVYLWKRDAIQRLVRRTAGIEPEA